MKEKLYRILDYVSEYGLYGMILVIPFSNAAIESLFGIIFLCFLSKKIIRPDFRFLKSTVYLFLFFFVFFMGLSLFNSGEFFVKGLIALFLKWMEYILILVITHDTLNNNKKMRNCLAVLLGTAFIIGIDAIFQLFSGSDFLRHRLLISLNSRMQYGVTASFHHYNSFGTYLVFNLSLALALLIALKGKLFKAALCALMVLLLACLMLAFSRGSWIGFLASLILMLFLSPRRNALVYIFFIFILVVIFFPGIRERTMLIFSPQGDADRFVVWKAAFKMIKEHPFLGKGVGTFMGHFQKYVESKRLFTQYAHNCYLQIWAETGIFALLSFILFAASIFYRSIKTMRLNGYSNPMLLGLICGFFAYLVQICFDSQLYSLELSVLFWFMAGFILAITNADAKIFDKSDNLI